MKKLFFLLVICICAQSCNAHKIPYNEIWYTNGSTTQSTTPHVTDVFGANIISNVYDAERECWIIEFDGDVTTIGQKAFFYCDSLTSVTIPDSVTTIGGYAFSQCYSLTNITIGDSVTTIGEGAFGCSSLTNITIPDSVTTIGKGAFRDCERLTSVYCKPTTPPTLGGSYVFDSNADGRTIYVPEESVRQYKIAAGWSEYADYIVGNDFSTTSFINYTTSDDQIINARLPIISNTYSNGIGTIEFLGSIIPKRAFYSCGSLTSVTIGDSVTTIGKGAFRDCDSLTSVTIGDSVTTIEDGAFAYRYSLTSVYCKATTPPSLGSNVFDANASGRKIYVPALSVEAYKSAEGWSEYADYIVGYDFSTTSFINYTTSDDQIINARLPIISNTYSNGIGTIEFLGSIIPVWAFYDCNSLTSVTIGDSVTMIGSSAFRGCSSLTNITIPDSVTTIGGAVFYDCDSLTSVTIPDSVTTIGGGAFCDCDNLTEFNGKLASEDGRCLIVDGTLNSFAPAGLTSYTIPDSVTTIGYGAFAYCTSLTSVTIPDSVTTIGNSAFINCTSLTSVTIPDSVTTIGGGAFCDCDNLTEFNGKLASEDGRYLIIDGTLNSFAPAGLTSYTIPDSVTTIGNSAFASCDSLTNITIPDSVTTIGGAVFYDCDSLTSVTIPDSVTTIGEWAFCACLSLTSVTIGDSVTTIGEMAFSQCSSLTSVTIPDSVTTIGDFAFNCCDSLTSVYCEATTPPSLGGSAIFDGNDSGRTIYVPAASVEAYKTADYWSKYADYIVGYDFENGVVVD